jgi:protein TonB
MKIPGSSPVRAATYEPLTSNDMSDRFNTAIIVSLIIHTILIFGITFKAANPDLFRVDKPLDVVLVNARSDTKPLMPEVLAQYNLDGGGNVDENRQAKSPLAASETESPASSKSLQEQIRVQEEKVHHLMAQAHSTYSVPAADVDSQPKPPSPIPAPQDLESSSLEMARLQARIDQEYEAYQKRPRRVFIGARAQEYSYARYNEDWRLKVERIGNLNYPEAAKQGHIHGALVLTVSIKSDGSLEDVQIDRSSGSKILDAAAIKIVRMSAPFAPFTAEMRKTVDVLSITRVWNFTNDLQTGNAPDQ